MKHSNFQKTVCVAVLVLLVAEARCEIGCVSPAESYAGSELENADEKIGKDDPAALYNRYREILTSDSHNKKEKKEAERQIKCAADAGYAPAQLLYGEYLLRTVGKEEDKTGLIAAVEYIKKSAEQDYVPAINFLYDKYGVELSLKYYEHAAANNIEEAYGGLALAYITSGQIDKCIKFLENKSSDSGIACVLLGYLHGGYIENVNGIEEDAVKSFGWFRKGAEKGNTIAIDNLASLYKYGIGTEANAVEAEKLYIEASEAGSEQAMYDLIMFYTDNVAIPENWDKAMPWILKLSQQDEVSEVSAKASLQLGKCYQWGLGVEKDYEKGFGCIKKAAGTGLPDACYELGRCYTYGLGCQRNPELAFECYRKAPEDHLKSVAALAQCYLYGRGTERNYEKAVELLTVAANRGDVQSQFDLGICYRQGEGVEVSIPTAMEWYRKAIDQGHSGAMLNMGILYENGIGVAVDKEKALSYYLMSAEKENKDALFCVGSCYEYGKGVEQDYKKAAEYYEKAVALEEPDAMYHLAIMYVEGRGVEKDDAKAVHLLLRSAKLGWKPAIQLLEHNNISIK